MTGGDIEPSKYTHIERGVRGTRRLCRLSASPVGEVIHMGGGDLRWDGQPVPLGGLGPNYGSIGGGRGGVDEV